MNEVRTPVARTLLLFASLVTMVAVGVAAAEPLPPRGTPPEASADLEITKATVTYLPSLDLLVFEQEVAGVAGGTTPNPRGSLDGAPVLGYVFPTTLAPEDVGFREAEGVVALAATAHPDFDDTPLWDENGNLVYDDDGVVWHPHWVVLVPDDRVAGGLSVRAIERADTASVLPPTHPGMPMYMDSPGFSVLRRANRLRVLVPAQRLRGKTDFRFDAVAAYMEVATTGARPMLGVHHVYSVLSGDLSLPFSVTRETR